MSRFASRVGGAQPSGPIPARLRRTSSTDSERTVVSDGRTALSSRFCVAVPGPVEQRHKALRRCQDRQHLRISPRPTGQHR